MKPFKSRLFNRIIKSDNPSFWPYLYAEIMFRLKVFDDLKCPCSQCYKDKHNLEWRLAEMENEGKIEKNFRPPDVNTFGYCGRAELPPRFKIK